MTNRAPQRGHLEQVRHESECDRQHNNGKIDKQACACAATFSFVTEKIDSCAYSKRMDQDGAQDGESEPTANGLKIATLMNLRHLIKIANPRICVILLAGSHI